MQFQVDGNLQYKCSTCRGECYQVCFMGPQSVYLFVVLYLPKACGLLPLII